VSERRVPATTRDLVTLAVLAALGGALSTFVGYLGNMVNLALGVPFGAGQFMAGLHVFWIVLMRVLVPNKVAGTLGGLLKGVVELFTGSTHGIVIVLVSLIQGAIIDVTALASGRVTDAPLKNRFRWWIGAGFSSATNVIVFQVFYFSNAPWIYLAAITLLSFTSGIIFAGYFAFETLEFLNETGLTASRFVSVRTPRPANTRRGLVLRNLPAVAIVLFLAVGSTYYVFGVAKILNDPSTCEVEGLVESPYIFRPSDFSAEVVTVEAELIGSYTHLPPANYTGILVSDILNRAVLKPEASGLRVTAKDGYTVLFTDISSIMSDDRFLLTLASDGLWLIAADYDGSMWVKMVSVLDVY